MLHTVQHRGVLWLLLEVHYRPRICGLGLYGGLEAL